MAKKKTDEKMVPKGGAGSLEFVEIDPELEEDLGLEALGDGPSFEDDEEFGDELDEESLGDLEDDLDIDDLSGDLEDDLDIDDLSGDLEDELDIALGDTAVVAPVVAPAESEEEDEDEEFEDELDEDDVEASLDEILRERLVVVEDEDDEELEGDDRSEIVVKVLPRQPDEFVCQSCFLVKKRSQLANESKLFCRDCV